VIDVDPAAIRLVTKDQRAAAGCSLGSSRRMGRRLSPIASGGMRMRVNAAPSLLVIHSDSAV